jgi:hypothetical protein
MRKEHGILRTNIDDWIEEFTFWRKHVSGKNCEEIGIIFIKILSLCFNE